ncbi:MAG: hypothetical protein U5L11_02535 [Arhodomonas sp.]|nr:hypothetical protein [Arhodomonas sp.]
MLDANNILVLSFAATLARAAVALVVVWLMLRIADKQATFNFREWLDHAQIDDPMAVSIYLGLRALGACLLVGFIFS